MPVVKNRLSKRISVPLANGKSVCLPGRGSIRITDEEFSPRKLRPLINEGKILVLSATRRLPKIITPDRA
jgi:hypothetical protein